MTIADDIAAVLLADATLVALATGGIYTFDETKRLGISSTNTPDVFDSHGILQPTILVKDRGQDYDGGITDDTTQALSYRQVCEIWLYNDGDSGYAVINTMRSRVFTLLHAKRINQRYCRWYSNLQNMRDPGLRYAGFTRSDYMTWGMQP